MPGQLLTGPSIRKSQYPLYVVFFVVTGIALFMTRSALKRYNTEKMETLFNFHLMNEIKMVIVMGAVIYGLCQYNQVNLAWIFLIFPIIYVILKNILIFVPVSSANQNAPVPKNFEQAEMMEKANIEYDHVINLQVSEEEVIRRLTARGRADDKPEIIKNRLKVYHRETAPLLTYYKDEIINIKAEGSTPEKISKEIIGKIQ